MVNKPSFVSDIGSIGKWILLLIYAFSLLVLAGYVIVFGYLYSFLVVSFVGGDCFSSKTKFQRIRREISRAG
jgi:hypothetical protein